MTDSPFIPSFDDEPSTKQGGTGGRKLCIICSKGNLDMAYPALILGNAALGEGIETHLFFTFWGFDLITKGRMEHLQFSFVGNTAMHPPKEVGGRELPLPKSFAMPQLLGIIPGMTSAATAMMKKQIADLDVPEVPDFLDLISASGGHLWGCKMSADMMGLTKADLYEGVEDIITATDFIEISDGAQLLFI